MPELMLRYSPEKLRYSPEKLRYGAEMLRYGPGKLRYSAEKLRYSPVSYCSVTQLFLLSPTRLPLTI